MENDEKWDFKKVFRRIKYLNGDLNEVYGSYRMI